MDTQPEQEERDSMLWMFEGLTSYRANVLSFRAGFHKPDEIADQFSDLAAFTTLDVAAEWRPLSDVGNDAVILGRRQGSWPSWQRNMFDAYNSGHVIWLEADAIIRQQSGGKRSLDDFAKDFFSGDDAGDVTRTFTFDDMVASLQRVQPYDWQGFFRKRLDDYGQGSLVKSIDQAGYELTGDCRTKTARLNVPLQAGSNEIAIALYASEHYELRPRTPYGWGLMMRFTNAAG